jgi:hypothetical protein
MSSPLFYAGLLCKEQLGERFVGAEFSFSLKVRDQVVQRDRAEISRVNLKTGLNVLSTCHGYFGARLGRDRTLARARALLPATVFYLPALLCVMVLDRRGV